MPVYVTSYLLPRNNAKWYVLEDLYLRGGFRVVANVAERDSMHASVKKARMVVITADDGIVWQLQPDNRTWAEFRTKSLYFPFYTHDQAEPSDKWAIVHNKDTKYLTYIVYDADGQQILPNEAVIVDTNTLELRFNTPVAGHAILTIAEQS
jgi:hypothetical protein